MSFNPSLEVNDSESWVLNFWRQMNDWNLILQSLIPNESFKTIDTDFLLDNILNPPKLENDLEHGWGDVGYADTEEGDD